ncbi:MAG: dihydrofolate reductase [Betaproteobacteria bacterium]|nr:dihydrofolate reductase [Betaproteobacteria bacterium]MDE2423743.1 dihydrofolate reductase [Betaproteobacteria bacterium]
MKHKPSLAMIVAMSENRVIGKDNTLPWHLPADLAFFKRTTLGHPVIMGRKTYLSIGKPLPGRRNLILSRDQHFSVANAEVYSSITDALDHCAETEQVFIIGGAELFKLTLDLTKDLYVTEIQANLDGDTYFPELDFSQWQVVSKTPHAQDEKNQYDMCFIHYQRR